MTGTNDPLIGEDRVGVQALGHYGQARKYIAPFEMFGQHDGNMVGGKIANLGQMLRAEIPVPPGFAVTRHGWDHFIEENGLLPKILKLHEGLDFKDELTRNERSAQLIALIKSASMPSDLAAEIREGYRSLSQDGRPIKVAVRSSAPKAEDLKNASAAGEHDSYLNIIGEDNVIAAVQACFASLFTSRAMWYRDENGIEVDGIGMAVAVQMMVQAVRSGIVFTADKVSGNTGIMTMSIGLGLGENLVQGAVDSDFIIVQKNPLVILERTVGAQKMQMVWSDELGKNVQRDVEPGLQDVLKATDDQILDLAEICLGVERHYGRHRDIEVAMDPTGRWRVVQSRDVTIRTIGFEEEPEPAVSAELIAKGLPASAGVAVGTVRIILDEHEVSHVEDGDVLTTEMTTPDFVDAMERSVAVAAQIGTPNSHAAIVSGELEIPCVVGASGILSKVQDGEVITVDGSHGKIYRGTVPELVAWNQRRDDKLSLMNEQMATIHTQTKVGLIAALPQAAARFSRRNADMVCLQRAEFLVAKGKRHPRDFARAGESELFIEMIAQGVRAYCQAFKPKHDVNPNHGLNVFRKLDFKTDEMMKLAGSVDFETPEKQFMLGKRGVFRYEWDPVTDEMETEALMRVAREYDNLVVMYPFPRTPEELGRAIERAVKQGLDVPFWAMVEVPMTAYFLKEFVEACQGRLVGLSIGSNDLLQGMMMIDREDDILAGRPEYSESHPLMRRLFRDIVSRGKELGLSVSFCGNAVSKFPEIAADLVEEGIDSIGVDVRKIDIVRQIVVETEARLGRNPAV